MVAAAAPLTSCLLSRYGNDYNKSGEGGGDSGVSYSERYPGPGAPTEYIVPRPPDTLANRALDEIAMDGLTSEFVGQLAEVGILSLRGLIEAEALVLAKQLGTPVTHVKRLQFLSRRASERLAEEVATVLDIEPTRLDTAGPFA